MRSESHTPDWRRLLDDLDGRDQLQLLAVVRDLLAEVEEMREELADIQRDLLALMSPDQRDK